MKVFAFCRYPEAGKVKTRLAAEIGDKATLAVYEKMLKIVFGNLKKSNYDFEVHHTGGERVNVDFWLQGMAHRQQVSGDLGARLSYAVAKWFSHNCEPVVIIGADQLEIDNALLTQVEEKLKFCDIVLGPAADGGYYLIGLNKDCPEIFKSISWGTTTVLAETVHKINQLGLSYSLLSVKQDIDYFADVPKEWQEEFMLHENSY